MTKFIIRILLALLSRFAPELVVKTPDDLMADMARVSRELDIQRTSSYARGRFDEKSRWQKVPALDREAPEVARTAELVAQFDPFPHSGEWKRHQVYAQLIKEFPAVSKRKLGLIIETVVNDEVSI